MSRFLREPQSEAGRYYIRMRSRKRAKKAEIERVKREAQERAERERLAQERLKQEQEEDADGEGDGDELNRFQKRVSRYFYHLFQLFDIDPIYMVSRKPT